MLCLQVIMPQLPYNIISILQHNVTIGPGRYTILGVTMAEHVCSSLTIKNKYGSEVCNPINTLKGICTYYHVRLALLNSYVFSLDKPD